MIKAVLFDFDGVIADSMHIVTTIESEVLQKVGLQLSPEYIAETYGGMGDTAFFQLMTAQYKLPLSGEDLVEQKRLLLEAKLPQVKPIEGSIELIHSLSQNGFKLAVGSGSPLYFIEMVLNSFQIKDKFKILLSADDVPRGKPYPDIYLKLAEILQVTPEECIVIEDSMNGMKASKAAGMRCIGLVGDKILSYPADVLVEKLSEIELNNLN